MVSQSTKFFSFVLPYVQHNLIYRRISYYSFLPYGKYFLSYVPVDYLQKDTVYIRFLDTMLVLKFFVLVLFVFPNICYSKSNNGNNF